METAAEPEKIVMLQESKSLISKVISDLRNLSKSLGMEHLAHRGLAKTIAEDLTRISRSGVFVVDFTVNGEAYELTEQQELVIYRIFQESVNNILKHSNAKNLMVNIIYQPEHFEIMISDDGNGFDVDAAVQKNGMGLINIKNRAKMLGAQAIIQSNPGKGSSVSLTLDQIIPPHNNN